MIRLRSLTHGTAVAAAALALALPARAEPTANQRATAEALFRRATELMDAQKFTEACEKFQASQDLDPMLGTLLYLADCYDRAGRSASAWALFQTASQKARLAGQGDRERIAKERADNLEARLSLLDVKVAPGRQVPGLEVSVGGTPVPAASFNTALPFDPGPTRVEARAPGRKPWAVVVDLAAGPTTQAVEIPELALLPRQATSPREPGRAPEPEKKSSSQGTLGVVTGAVGLVTLGVAAYFGYRAYDLNRRSKAQCRQEDRNACTPAGVGMRDDARTAGTLSTVATTSGALLVAGGFVILLTAPSDDAPAERQRAQAFSPEAGDPAPQATSFEARGLGLAVGGVF
jgi:tetratricopeptide (TPR) repeat protein